MSPVLTCTSLDAGYHKLPVVRNLNLEVRPGEQMLVPARALVALPKVVLIDELSTGLAPVVVQKILPVVRRIADEKQTAVVLVEQHVHMALQIADRAMVLAHGDVVLERPAAELRANPELLKESYLGRTA